MINVALELPNLRVILNSNSLVHFYLIVVARATVV